MFTGIARSQKEHLSFWFTYRIKMLWKIQPCSNSNFQLTAPQTHPAAWKSSPPRQRTQLCISVPAASPQCCTSALLRTQTHHGPSSGNQWCRRRVGTNRNPPWKSISQKEKICKWQHRMSKRGGGKQLVGIQIQEWGRKLYSGLRFPNFQGIWQRRHRMWPWWVPNNL